MKSYLALLAVIVLAVTGCTNFKVIREYHIAQGSYNEEAAAAAVASDGDKKAPTTVNVLYLNLDADVESEMTTDQKATLQSELALAKDQAQTQLVKKGPAVLKDFVNKMTKPDEVVIEPKPLPGEEEVDQKLEGGNTEGTPTVPTVGELRGFKYKVRKGINNILADGRPFYRLGVVPQDVWGQEILIVGVTDGLEFHITDTTKNADLFGNKEVFFFNGTDPSEKGTFDGKASLFWKRNGSTQVDIYYNGVE